MNCPNAFAAHADACLAVVVLAAETQRGRSVPPAGATRRLALSRYMFKAAGLASWSIAGLHAKIMQAEMQTPMQPLVPCWGRNPEAFIFEPP